MKNLKDISFGGIANTLPDDLCNNGDVSLAYNLTSQTPVSTPMRPSETQLKHIDGCTILLIHEGSSFKNVFVINPEGNVLAYRYSDLLQDADPEALASVTGTPTSCSILGNVVILTFPEGCKYLYRSGDKYIVRSNKVPPISMSIVAACRYVAPFLDSEKGKNKYIYAGAPDGIDPQFAAGNYEEAGKDIKNYTTPEGETNSAQTEENSVEQALMSSATKLIADWGDYGYLFSPVLVRAAIKLKTGETVSLTNPILCYPLPTAPIKIFCPYGTLTNMFKGYFLTRGIAYKLFAKVAFDGDYEEWKDIIGSIDVYMSTPIYTHSTSGRDLRRSKTPAFVNILKIEEFEGAMKNYSEYIGEKIFTVSLGTKDSLSYSELEKISSFYKVRSIPFAKDMNKDVTSTGALTEDYKKEIYYSRETYGESEEYPYSKYYDSFLGYRKLLTTYNGKDMNVTSESLSTLPTLDDALRSNIVHYPDKTVTYNSRLIEIGETLDYSSLSEVSLSYFDKYLRLYRLLEVPANVTRDAISSTYINFCYAIGMNSTTGATFYAKTNIRILGTGAVPKYLTIEEPNITKVVGYATAEWGTPMVVTLKFKKHDFLNLAYFAGDVKTEPVKKNGAYSQAWLDFCGHMAVITDDPDSMFYREGAYDSEAFKTHRSDYIRESDVADPYSFQDSNTAYFNSDIKDVLVVPQAISLGQYGSNQLYVLCQNGIYTVGIDSAGQLSSVNSFSKDTISNSSKACIASSRLVANNGTSWDVYEGQTKQTILQIDRNLTFVYDNLPRLSEVPGASAWKGLLPSNVVFDFLSSCSLAYDGVHDMIFGLSNDYDFMAVYRKGLGLHFVPNKASDVVTANNLVLSSRGGLVYDYSASALASVSDGLIITRPFRLCDSNGLFTVNKIIVRGMFDKSHLGLLLYGTRNYRNYHLVKTSCKHYITNVLGTPYKAYRLAISAQLSRDEYISHCSVEFENREVGRIHF